MLLEAPQIWRMKRYNVLETELVYIDQASLHADFFFYIVPCTLNEDIIQILTGTVMKNHVSVDCQESYFSQGIIFSRSAQRWGKILSRGEI